jgi:anhydro-N-acetylmuramic acid kinase
MPRYLRFEGPPGTDPRRWTIGLVVSSACNHLDAALLTATGGGLALETEVAGMKRVQGCGEAASLFANLAAATPTAGNSFAVLREQLAEAEAVLVHELLAEADVSPHRVLAVAVHDPGLWQLGKSCPGGYLGLCDAARLAELTGLSVIDAFVDRDLALGGQGGPLTAVAQWLLLRLKDRAQVLLDLGRTTRMSYLPAAADPGAMARILSFDVGPGTRLLDLLTSRLTGGQHHFDPGGRLAVQGRRIGELIEHWLADPYFERPLPRWHPQGVRPERFLTESLQMAVEREWSIRDLLCSATHFVAETVVRAFRRRLPEDANVGQILVTGGGQLNGMLLREIAARLPEIPLVRIGELGINREALDATAVAVMGLMFLDQVPANPTSVTGAELPRVLGRITPGSPQNWQRLLQGLTGSRPVVRPLRSAM